MTRILLTNDDGIHSGGLVKLEAALSEVGDVYTVAPLSEMSGASHSLTLARPLRIRQLARLGEQLVRIEYRDQVRRHIEHVVEHLAAKFTFVGNQLFDQFAIVLL